MTVNSPEELKHYYNTVKYRTIREGFDGPIVINRTSDFQFRAHWEQSGFFQDPVDWSRYILYPMPGCCGVVVYSGAYIHHPQRSNGLGQHFFSEANGLMKDAGYSCGLCTVISTMKSQIHILEKSGWSKVHSFVNRRTENEVQIWVKNINQPDNKKELPVVSRIVNP